MMTAAGDGTACLWQIHEIHTLATPQTRDIVFSTDVLVSRQELHVRQTIDIDKIAAGSYVLLLIFERAGEDEPAPRSFAAGQRGEAGERVLAQVERIDVGGEVESG